MVLGKGHTLGQGLGGKDWHKHVISADSVDFFCNQDYDFPTMNV